MHSATEAPFVRSIPSGQTLSHILQSRHLSAFILGFTKGLILLMTARSAPTGQRHLHHNLFSPRLKAPAAGTRAISNPATNMLPPPNRPLQIVPIGQKAQ